MMRTVALEMLSGLRHLVDLYHHVERVVVDHVPFLSQRSGDGKKQQSSNDQPGMHWTGVPGRPS